MFVVITNINLSIYLHPSWWHHCYDPIYDLLFWKHGPLRVPSLRLKHKGSGEEHEWGNKGGRLPQSCTQIPCVLSWPDLVTSVNPLPSPMGLGSQQLNTEALPPQQAWTNCLDWSTPIRPYNTGRMKQIRILPGNKKLVQYPTFQLPKLCLILEFMLRLILWILVPGY